MFHVYNRFDSMDCIHVCAGTEGEAIDLAIADGFITNTLGVKECDIVAYPFLNSEKTSMYIRRISSKGVVEAGR